MTPLRRLCLATVLLLPLAASAQTPAEMPRQVSVSGEGEVAVRPDRARLRIGVTHVNADLRTAENQVNGVVRAYLTEAKALGAKDEQISTTGIAIQPEYQWEEKDRVNRLVGYRVSRDIEVTVDNLDKLGDYVLRATKAGVNQVQPPQLESSKAADLRKQALVIATRDAQAKAKLIADTLGVKLGAVRALQAGESSPQPPMPKMMAMRADAASDGGNQELGFSAGEIRYSANVQASFDLLAP